MASAFGAAFSLPTGRALVAVCLVLSVVSLIRARGRLRLPPVAWAAVAFVLVTVGATLQGIHPSVGIPKLTKLIWFVGLPLAAARVTDMRRLRILLSAYAAGSGVLAIKTLVGQPLHALRDLAAGLQPDRLSSLISAGSMTAAQQLMLGLLASAALLITALRRRERYAWVWGVLVVLTGAGLMLTFKRGSWICAAAMLAVLVATRLNWRWLAAGAVGALCLLSLPFVRERMAGLADEFGEQRGGRLTMWAEITPVLIREHPWGIGYRVLTNEMMREIAPDVEAGRTHLHSNPCQVLVESGWLGLAVYLLWMGLGVADAVRLALRYGARHALDAVALAPLLLLVALLLNGLIEYNLGDGEIVLAYALILGMAGAARGWSAGTAVPQAE